MKKRVEFTEKSLIKRKDITEERKQLSTRFNVNKTGLKGDLNL
jgi:hypothetical protein